MARFFSVKRQTEYLAHFPLWFSRSAELAYSQSEHYYDAVIEANHRMGPAIYCRPLRNALLLILLAACGIALQAQESGSQTATPLARAIDRTLEQGHDAILPPHISRLLGISPNEHEVPVKQFAEMGEPIRGFEVSTAQTNDVVIWVESRAQKQTTYYLMSRRGTLRKVLDVVEGTGYPRQPTKDDQQAFEKEKQKWLDQLAPKHS